MAGDSEALEEAYLANLGSTVKPPWDDEAGSPGLLENGTGRV
jgi:hypothetical protein